MKITMLTPPIAAVSVPSAAPDEALDARVDLATGTDVESVPSVPQLQDLRTQYYDFSFYPEEIFGNVPDGFVLEDQSLEMLCHWHRKAIEAADRPGTDDETLSEYCQMKNKILGAILAAPVSRVGQVAAKRG